MYLSDVWVIVRPWIITVLARGVLGLWSVGETRR